MSTATSTRFRTGVLHGDEVTELFSYANENDFALPAVNVVGSNTIIGEEAFVGMDGRIRTLSIVGDTSMLWEGVTISPLAIINTGTIIQDYVHIGRGVEIGRLTI